MNRRSAISAFVRRKKRPESGKPRKQPSLTMDQHLSAVSGCNSFGWPRQITVHSYSDMYSIVSFDRSSLVLDPTSACSSTASRTSLSRALKLSSAVLVDLLPFSTRARSFYSSFQHASHGIRTVEMSSPPFTCISTHNAIVAIEYLTGPGKYSMHCFR